MARQLAKRLLAAIPATDKPVLFPQAETGREELLLGLRGAAQRRKKIAVYQTVPATKEALPGGRYSSCGSGALIVGQSEVKTRRSCSMCCQTKRRRCLPVSGGRD